MRLVPLSGPFPFHVILVTYVDTGQLIPFRYGSMGTEAIRTGDVPATLALFGGVWQGSLVEGKFNNFHYL